MNEDDLEIIKSDYEGCLLGKSKLMKSKVISLKKIIKIIDFNSFFFNIKYNDNEYKII